MVQGTPKPANSKDPDWTREEIILAFDLVRDNNGKSLEESDLRVIELSNLLQRNPLHPLASRSAKFRNPNGVALKTGNIVTNRPGYTGTPTKAGAETRRVVEEFHNDMGGLQKVATAIRLELETNAYVPLVNDPENEYEYEGEEEGRLLLAKHLRRERNRKLRSKKIAHVKDRGELIACEVCSFDFALVYGDRGKDFIEVHHVLPLHASGPVTTKLADLALLCSNCHRMIHRGNPWLSVDELKLLISSGVSTEKA